MGALVCEERLRNMGLFTQEMRGIQEANGDFLVSKGGSKTDRSRQEKERKLN